MSRFVWRRLGVELSRAVVSLFLLVSASFFLMRLTGNPIAIALGDKLSEVELQKRIVSAGLDKPVGEQFTQYITHLFQLNLGASIFSGESVALRIVSVIGATVELAIPALVIGIGLAYSGAFLAVRIRSRSFQKIYLLVVIGLLAIPAFLLGALARTVAGLAAINAPTTGRLSLVNQIQYERFESKTGFVLLDSFLAGEQAVFLDGLFHLWLPVSVLALFVAAALARPFYAQLQMAQTSGYVLGARAKGVSENRIVLRHSTRTVLSSLISISGLEIAAVLTGAIYVENTFEIRGLGFLLVDSVIARDFPIVQGLVIVIGLSVIFINLLASSWAKIVEPRAQR